VLQLVIYLVVAGLGSVAAPSSPPAARAWTSCDSMVARWAHY
jgi:hypothetical protein